MKLTVLDDLQKKWLLLYYCAVPRVNHIIRTAPPDLVYHYAQGHDAAILQTFGNIFHIPSDLFSDVKIVREFFPLGIDRPWDAGGSVGPRFVFKNSNSFGPLSGGLDGFVKVSIKSAFVNRFSHSVCPSIS